MKVERGLAGFALPFAIGVGIAVYYGNTSYETAFIFALLSFYMCITITSAMMYSIGFGNIIILAGLSSGLMIGFGSTILDVSEVPHDILEISRTIGKQLSAAADRIPFTDSDTNALVKALLTGDRSSLPLKVKETFRLSGASHILALSGLHLGIIYGITSKVLTIIGNSRRSKIISSSLLVLLCGGYTMITGASPSICRALIFITLRECARLSFRSCELKQILMTSLLLHLTISPQSITFVGFQLSYSAMFGIAYIYPWLKEIWPSENTGKTQEFKLLHKIWDISALSTACQITAGTMAWIYFGTFPKCFIITNLITIPLSSILIPLALLTLLSECIGTSPGLIITATESICSLLTKTLYIISNI